MFFFSLICIKLLGDSAFILFVELLLLMGVFWGNISIMLGSRTEFLLRSEYAYLYL